MRRHRLTWLEEVYRTHHEKTRRLCLRFGGGDDAWARDRAHDVFVKVAENAELLRTQNDVGGWIHRVAVNECLMVLRKSQRRRVLRDRIEAPDGPPSPEREVQTSRSVRALARAIEDLPAREQSLVHMVHVEGQSQTEAAARMGVSKGYASKIHSRAIRMLRVDPRAALCAP